MKNASPMKVFSGFLMVGQLGFSLITPILLCTLLGVWLSNRFSLGAWVIVVAVLIGVISAGCSFYSFARNVLYQQEQEKETDTNENHQGS